MEKPRPRSDHTRMRGDLITSRLPEAVTARCAYLRIAISAVPDATCDAAREREGGRRCEMTTLSHEPSRSVQEQRRRSEFLVPEMWASLTIIVMWLSVLFDAVFGPDIVTSGVSGRQRDRSVSGCRGTVRVPRHMGCRSIRLRPRAKARLRAERGRRTTLRPARDLIPTGEVRSGRSSSAPMRPASMSLRFSRVRDATSRSAGSAD